MQQDYGRWSKFYEPFLLISLLVVSVPSFADQRTIAIGVYTEDRLSSESEPWSIDANHELPQLINDRLATELNQVRRVKANSYLLKKGKHHTPANVVRDYINRPLGFKNYDKILVRTHVRAAKIGGEWVVRLSAKMINAESGEVLLAAADASRTIPENSLNQNLCIEASQGSTEVISASCLENIIGPLAEDAAIFLKSRLNEEYKLDTQDPPPPHSLPKPTRRIPPNGNRGVR